MRNSAKNNTYQRKQLGKSHNGNVVLKQLGINNANLRIGGVGREGGKKTKRVDAQMLVLAGVFLVLTKVLLAGELKFSRHIATGTNNAQFFNASGNHHDSFFGNSLPETRKQDSFPFTICHNWTNGDQSTVAYENHKHTDRNLDDFHLFFPHFFDWYSKGVEVMGTSAKVLEVGCGSARALLELQNRNPYADAFGTNVNGWGREQVDIVGGADSDSTTQKLLEVAQFFRVHVYCNAKSQKLILPSLVSAQGIQNADLPFEQESFDFIISRHSFDRGKLKPSESHFILPRVIKVLNPGGSALLQFRCLAKPLMDLQADPSAWTVHGDDKSFLVLDVLKLETEAPIDKTSTSVVFFQNLHLMPPSYSSDKKHCVMVLIKKCLPEDSRHSETGDCIIPSTEKAPMDWLKNKEDWIQQIEKTQQSVQSNYDQYQYFSNMVNNLKNSQ